MAELALFLQTPYGLVLVSMVAAVVTLGYVAWLAVWS